MASKRHLLAMASSRIRKQTRLGKLTLPLLSLYRRVTRSSSSLLMEIPARKSGRQSKPVSGEEAGSGGGPLLHKAQEACAEGLAAFHHCFLLSLALWPVLSFCLVFLWFSSFLFLGGGWAPTTVF